MSQYRLNKEIICIPVPYIALDCFVYQINQSISRYLYLITCTIGGTFHDIHFHKIIVPIYAIQLYEYLF